MPVERIRFFQVHNLRASVVAEENFTIVQRSMKFTRAKGYPLAADGAAGCSSRKR
jgi:hypothetical protein